MIKTNLVHKCMKMLQVNQIFNKVGGSNGKGKRDRVLKKIAQDRKLWKLFTNQEEYDPILLDKYWRFPYYLNNHRNIFEPEISNFLIKNGLDLKYPEGRKFAVCLTHDIDFLCTGMLNTVTKTLKALKRGQFAEALCFHLKNK